MHSKIFILISIICCLFLKTVSSKDKGFLATFPSSVIPGGTAQFCIRFFNVNEDVVLKIFNEQNVFDQIHETVSSIEGTCYNIKINKNAVDDPYRLSLTVSGETVDGSYKFTNTKLFSIKKTSTLTFVETDKPVYKPGQQVNIRILTIDYQMSPVDKIYQEVYVQDDSNTRIYQWLNVHSYFGLVSLNFSISEEPNFGKWQIFVNEIIKKDPIVTAFFEVKKYVLPKFELQLLTPSNILINEEEITINACAKYSFGKNVKGEVELKFLTKSYYFSERPPKLIHLEKLNGCKEIKFSTKKFGFKSDTYLSNLVIKGKFKEDDTEITAEAEKSINIIYRKYKLELLEPKYFKPGLPTTAKIQIKSKDNSPVKNVKIHVTIKQFNSNLFENDYESDDNGLFYIDFHSPACSDKTDCDRAHQLYLDVVVDEELNNTKLHSSSTGFGMQPWYSKSNTYLQIYTNEYNKFNSIECNSKVDFNIKLRSNDPVKGNIYFQIQSRASVVYAGSYNLDTKQINLSIGQQNDDENKNTIKKRASDPSVWLDICTLNLNIGNGDYNFKRWYYDDKLKKCVQFIYKGYGGNHNNFATEYSCNNNCGHKGSTKTAKIIFAESNDDDNITSVTLSVLINEEMSPELRILAFYVINGEVIPDSVTLPVKKCLKNKINLSINENQKSVNTGSNVKIKLTGAPNSLCALSAIDKSVTFMGQRNSIDLENIFERLSTFDLQYDYRNNYPETENCEYNNPYRPIPIRVIEKKSIIFPSYGHNINNAVEAFKKANVIHLTDLEVQKKGSCFRGRNSLVVEQGRNQLDNEPGTFIALPYASVDSFEPIKPIESINEVVREFFPETWLWNVGILNEDGLLELTEKAPDSITDWVFNAYCLSKEYNIGVSPQVSLSVFQPFFVSVNLPYSVIKDEQFPVHASVFSYIYQCLPVLIQFKSDSRIGLINPLLSSIKKCVCPDEKVTHTFLSKALDFDTEFGVNVTVRVSALDETYVCPENVGEIAIINYADTEIRNVLVEAEGIKNEIVKSVFATINASTVTENFVIKLPQYVVPRSVRAYLSVIGDPMGPALNNLENLVQLPTGCGEQNMIRFAPLVSVTKYLRDTSQLNEKISKSAEEYLKIGYQRQLTYRHKDGSFSAFGNSDKLGGGTWLTAFVLRCLSQSYGLDQVKIDQNDIDISFNWLLNIQSADGAFKNVGTPLLSKGLSGGLGDVEVGLSAYVLISLLTALNSTNIKITNKQKIDRGLLYLKQNVQNFDVTNTYTLALTLYAFKLANENKDAISEIENELEIRAKVDGGFKYWKEIDNQEEDKEDTENYYYKPRSADIEITSYVLLAKLFNFRSEDAQLILPIAKWINSQRNSLGGFFSTQDTVVALDALSQFASKFYSKRINMRVSISQNGINHRPFSVGQTNRLLSQRLRIAFNETRENIFNVSVVGSGSALAQIAVRYNIKREIKSQRNFDLKIQSVDKGDCKAVSVEVKTSFKGNNGGKCSSMAIVQLRLPSGWTPIDTSINNLLKDSNLGLKRHEINENKVALYFDEISQQGKVFKFDIVKSFDVKHTKPGVVSVYDYYESPDDSVNQEFTIPCIF